MSEASVLRVAMEIDNEGGILRELPWSLMTTLGPHEPGAQNVFFILT